MTRDRGIVIQGMFVQQLRQLAAGDKPHLGTIRRAIADELGRCSLDELRAAVLALRYAGKLHWDRLELSPSMLTDCGSDVAAADDVAPNPEWPADYASAPRAEEPGAAAVPEPAAETSNSPPAPSTSPVTAAVDGPDPTSALTPRIPKRPEPEASEAPPARPLHRKTLARVRTASAHAGHRPAPPPRHESEVARAVRLEAEEKGRRRRGAHIPSTKRSLDLVREGGLSLVEAVSTMLAEEPADLITAIRRRHAAAWERIIVSARAADKRPGELLYDVLERGLAGIEADHLEEDRDAA